MTDVNDLELGSLEEGVYSPEMAKTLEHISQEISDLGKHIDKSDEKRDKLGEKLQVLIENRVIPTELRVNQIHGIGKWAVPAVIVLLVAIAGMGGRLMYSVGKLDGKTGGILNAQASLKQEVAKVYTNQIFGPQSPASEPTPLEIKEAAVRAKESKLPIQLAAIQRISEPFLRQVNPATWDVTIALLNLRSFVNSTLPDSQIFRIARVFTAKDANKFFTWPQGNELLAIERDSVLLDPVGKEDQRYGLVFVDETGAIKKSWENVVFRNCTIKYSGRPVKLKNVFFENCTFEIDPNEGGSNLAREIINSTTISSTV